MSSEIISPSQLTPLPAPRVGIAIRPGTLSDVAFMDSLQKKTTKQVGWMPTKQFEGKVGAGHVLVAEATGLGAWGLGLGGNAEGPGFSPSPKAQGPRPTAVGYLIGNDQYFKRDDVGIIYQINVVPEFRRSLVAAALLQAQFERSAYGCKLYCCWCAQDIEANRFWESMGFVPLAFRTGGKVKLKRDVETKRQRDEVEGDPAHSVSSSLCLSVSSARVHIFWQKRIRANDLATPWWFPAKTDGGAIREDRIVLPIPPGVHWTDVRPVVLPGEGVATDNLQCAMEDRRDGGSAVEAAAIGNRKPQIENRKRAKKDAKVVDPVSQPVAAAMKQPARLWFGGVAKASGDDTGSVETNAAQAQAARNEKPKRQKKKHDPQQVAAARELRDRYLDEVNAGRCVIEPVAAKYDVGRSLAGMSPIAMKQIAA